jgi:hypothetical protein
MLVAELTAAMRFFITMALLMATIAASPGAYGYSAPNAAALAKSPAPVSAECWIFGKIYPANRAAFASRKVTREQQLEVLKWARPASPAQTKLVKAASPWATPPSVSELGMVRWMRDGSDQSILVFVARPFFETGSTWHRPWVALNSNEFIDPVLCQMGAYPTA